MMRVELITHTPEPEKVVATAAKLCYSSSDIASLREGLTEEKTKSFIERLVCLLSSVGKTQNCVLLSKKPALCK